jgi:hypothetical protein
MDVPSTDAFSPISDLVSRFGLPNPLEFLDLMQNSLEQIDRSTEAWDKIAGTLEGVSNKLKSELEAVNWQGPAADSARQEGTTTAQALTTTQGETQQAAQGASEAKVDIWRVIKWILMAIGALAAILAVTFAIALASSTWSFGSSLLLWIAEATGLSLGVIAAITGAIATACGILVGILGELQAFYG